MHALHAARHNKVPVVIIAEDTDVFILGLAFNSWITVPLYQMFGKARKKLYDLHKVAAVVVKMFANHS